MAVTGGGVGTMAAAYLANPPVVNLQVLLTWVRASLSACILLIPSEVLPQVFDPDIYPVCPHRSRHMAHPQKIAADRFPH